MSRSRRLRRQVLTLLALLPALAAAQAPEGKLYTPGAFERLDVAGAAEVKLTQGESDQVFVIGDARTQKNVQVELSGRRLLIRSTDSWKFWNTSRLQVEVQMRAMTHLMLSGASDLHAPAAFKAEQLSVSISGAGQVRFDELTAEHLRFGISGAGDGLLRGQVGTLSLDVSGKGKLMAEDLRARQARVSISGIGNASLWVTEDLRVSVSGVGSVDYWGKPQVQRSSSGMASISGHGDKR